MPSGWLVAGCRLGGAATDTRRRGVHVFAQTGDLLRFFADYVAGERLEYASRTTGVSGGGPHLFGRSLVFAGNETRMFVGEAERLEIEVRTLDGELVMILRGPDSERPIDDRLVSWYRDAELSGPDAHLRNYLADADYRMPERYPAYTELLVDPLGFVWVERFLLPWDEERRWGVFSPEGSFLGHVHVPAGLRVTDVTEDHVVGIIRDELDVPRIQVYRLDRAD